MFLLQLLLGFPALIGMGFLPHPFGIILFLAWAVQLIFWKLLQEYYPYADRVRGYPSAERGVYRRLFSRKAMPSLTHLTVPKQSVLAQDAAGNLFQIIRYKQVLYFRMLRPRHSLNDDAILQNHLMTYYPNLSSGKKCGKKDFRFPVSQVQSVSYIEKPVENTRYAAFGILQLEMKDNTDKKIHRYYLLSKLSAAELALMFDPVPFVDETKTILEYNTVWSVLKTLGTPRLCNLILQVGLWFSTAWLLSFTILSSSYLFLPLTFWLICTVLLMLLCWTNGSLFFWGKADDTEQPGLFGTSPCVHYALFAPMLIQLAFLTHRVNLVVSDWGRYAVICFIFAVVLSVLFLYFCRNRTASGVAWMIGLSFLFSILSVVCANQLYDPYIPEEQAVIIIEKEYHRGGTKSPGSYYITVQRSDKSQEELTVTGRYYYTVEEDDTVILQKPPGLFGIAYFTLE
ncbi:hypothetical protein [Ruminococcus sp.]|uniref:hypothetical protein n=1 Tax=Ruminococcus sp. TaxID=41978 RepID=UPI0025D47BF6|nr:hypothetical protein [Ruminococcus sp.]